MKKGASNKYIFTIFLLILAVVSFMILKPFVSDLLTAMIIAYMFYPIHKWVQKKIKNKFISSLLVVILIFLLIAIPLTWVVNSFYGEVRDLIIMQNYLPGNDNNTSQLLTLKKLGEIAMERTDLFSKTYEIFQFVSRISSSIIHFFITMFMTFFFIKDGDKFAKFLKDTLRFKTGYGLDVAEIMQKTIHAVVYGIIIVAIIQGIVAGLGYGVLSGFGAIKNPVFWAILTVLAALIPTIGTGLIWFPMSLYVGAKGILFDEISLIILAGALLLYGGLVVGTIDNFIRPKLIGDRANIHPVVVLIGVLGGIGVFGFIGIIFGPVIFALAQEIIVMYKNNKLF